MITNNVHQFTLSSRMYSVKVTNSILSVVNILKKIVLYSQIFRKYHIIFYNPDEMILCVINYL